MNMLINKKVIVSIILGIMLTTLITPVWAATTITSYTTTKNIEAGKTDKVYAKGVKGGDIYWNSSDNSIIKIMGGNNSFCEIKGVKAGNAKVIIKDVNKKELGKINITVTKATTNTSSKNTSVTTNNKNSSSGSLLGSFISLITKGTETTSTNSKNTLEATKSTSSKNTSVTTNNSKNSSSESLLDSFFSLITKGTEATIKIGSSIFGSLLGTKTTNNTEKTETKVTSTPSNTVKTEAKVTSTTSNSRIIHCTVTAYCPCKICCGKYASGITASGKKATANHTIAADTSVLPLETQVIIKGKRYVVEDRGGAIKGNKIDIYFNTHQEALNFGKQYLDVEVINK